MGFFGIFRRSKREVIRDNAAKGERAEKVVKSEYEMAGYKMKRTGKGHDYKATRRNWFNGKNETKYVEVKTGDAELSPLQKKKKKRLGKKYVVERRDPNPLPGVFDSGTAKRKSSGGLGLLGGGSDPPKRTRTAKRKSSGGLGLLGGGSDPPKRTRTAKRKSSGGLGLLGGGSGRSRRRSSIF